MLWRSKLALEFYIIPITIGTPDDSTIFRAEIQPAYVENSQVRTTLSWLDHPKCTSERRDFNVRLQSVRCAKQVNREQLIGGQCVAPLEHLHFSCEYLVEVRDQKDGQVIRFFVEPGKFKFRRLENRPQF